MPTTVKQRRAHPRVLSDAAAVLFMRCDTGRYRAGQHLPTAAALAGELAVPVTDVVAARTQLSGYGVVTEGRAGDGYTVTPRDQWVLYRPPVSGPARRAVSFLRTGIRTGHYRAGAVLPDEAHLWSLVGVTAEHRQEACLILVCEGLITLPVGGAPAVVRAQDPAEPAASCEAASGPTLVEAALAALLVRGVTNTEMAAQLRLSRTTTLHHLTRIGTRLAASSRANRVHAVLSRGWITPPPAHGPAPVLDGNDLLLLRSLAELPDRVAIGDAMAGVVSTPKALSARIRELTQRSKARSEEHLVALGHTWGLLGPSSQPGGSRLRVRREAAPPQARPPVSGPAPSDPPVDGIVSRILLGVEDGRYVSGIRLSPAALASDLGVPAATASRAMAALLAEGVLEPLRNGATPAGRQAVEAGRPEYLADRIRDQIAFGLYPVGRPLAHVTSLAAHFVSSPHQLQAAARILLAEGTVARVLSSPYLVQDDSRHTTPARLPLPVPAGRRLGPAETDALIRSARGRWQARSYTAPETLRGEWELLRNTAVHVLRADDATLPTRRLLEAVTLPAPDGSYLRQWHNAALATALQSLTHTECHTERHTDSPGAAWPEIPRTPH
ncbi:hypothetical protein [Streptomyces venezuelae]|uniref:hypothetical protein n=1 Tax=Streptomyces venezuelae TaxID=54571 RepID=UPI00332860EF